jgi:TM2 domain-containing membrane protein YozV
MNDMQSTPPPDPSAPPIGVAPESKRVLAGILAILLGWLGVHKFVLGYTTEGVVQLCASVGLAIVTCGILGWVGALVGLIEGIIYLTKSDAEFVRVYQLGKRGWF